MPVAEAANATREHDARLVAQMAVGNSGAPLAEFYDRYAARVMAVLVKMLRSRAIAEERHQDVFLELWRRAPQYDRGRASVATWVMTIARSRALDTIRSQARRKAEARVPAEDANLAAPASSSPAEQTETAQRRRKLQAALATLSTEQASVLEMAYFRGLSHSEIALELELPLGTVKSRILGGMKVLRKTLADGGLP